MDYDQLRHFADSWGLLAMALVFAGILVRVLLRSRGDYSEQADIPFKHDDDTRNSRDG